MLIKASARYLSFKNSLFLLVCMTGVALAPSCTRSVKDVADHTVQLDTVLDKANSLLNSGAISRSEKYLDSAYNTIQAPGTYDLWRKYEHKVNFYLLYQRDVEQANIYADSMIRVLEDKSEKYPTEYAKSIFSLSEVLMAQKRYTEAFNSYYRGKTFASKYLDRCDSYEFSYKLGLARYRQDEYLEAIPFLKQSYNEGGSCTANDGFEKTFAARQRNLNTIALCFERTGLPDSAVVYYKKALAFIDANAGRHPDRADFVATAKGVIQGNLGGVYAALNEVGLAEKYLAESIKANDRPMHDLRDAQTAKLKLAALYIKTNKIEASEELLNQLQAYLAAPENNNSPVAEQIRLQFYKIKWNYYDKTLQIPTAYQYALKYHAFQDSIDRVNEGLKDVDMDLIFKDAEQRHKLELLNKDNQLHFGFMIGAVIICILAFIVLTVVWLNLKNSRKLNKKMSDQNKQMQTALNALQQSQDENTRIIKIIAHDLRSPIAATVSIANLLLDQQHLNAEDKEMLEMMKSSNVQSLDMINDLLNINTSIGGLKKERVEIQLLLHECVEMLKFKAEEKNQKIELRSKDQVVCLNREKIWRVVNNLLVNAIKFSPEHSTIDISADTMDDTIQIRIKDQGIGVPDGLQDKLFDMFTDARRMGTAGEKSFGMGLAISQQIVEAHGGKIWFENNPDIGTTFILQLPLRDSGS
ncbi:MAG: HAMP domain-containing histidine kinase [Pedobacter sp.]|nr:MAG: HAMP domain-containing histidine kinase [Pedobacter sp.]